MQGFYKVDVYFFDKMFPASARFSTVGDFWGVALSRLAMLVRERLLYQQVVRYLSGELEPREITRD